MGALKADAFALVADMRGCRRQVQLPSKIPGAITCAKPQMQVPEDLVAPEWHVGPVAMTGTWTLACEVGVDQFLGLDIFSFEQEAANFRQSFEGVRPVRILR